MRNLISHELSAYTMVMRVAIRPATPARITKTVPNRVPVPLGSDKSPFIVSFERVLMEVSRKSCIENSSQAVSIEAEPISFLRET